MKYRKLRIAFSAVCGIICLLLVALWVRSYWWADYILHKGAATIVLENEPGLFVIRWADFDISQPGETPWEITSIYHEQLPNFKQHSQLFPFVLYKTQTADVSIFVPFWLLAFVVAAVAAIPWIRWSKRFSLRTLLIAITLVAVALGLIVFYANRPPLTPPLDNSDWNTR